MVKQSIIAFIMVCAYVVATLGGFGYALWGGSWPVAISIILLAWMAWPKFNEFRKIIL